MHNFMHHTYNRMHTTELTDCAWHVDRTHHGKTHRNSHGWIPLPLFHDKRHSPQRRFVPGPGGEFHPPDTADVGFAMPKFLSPSDTICSLNFACAVALCLCGELPNGSACHATGCRHPLLMKRCQEISWRKGDQMQRLFPSSTSKVANHAKLRETWHDDMEDGG